MSSGVPLNDHDREPWLELIRKRAEELAFDRQTMDEDSASKKEVKGVVAGCSALKKYYREILRGRLKPATESTTIPENIAPPSPATLPTYFVFINGPREVLYDRMSKRPGHFFKASMLDSQLATLEDPTGEEGVIVVSLESTTEEQIALAKLELGKLLVEYAMEAISHAGTVLGVLAKDGVVLAAEKKVTGKLLDLSASTQGGYGGSGEKIFLLNTNVIGGVAGLTADANSLVNFCRSAAQRHLLTYNEDIPVELLAQRLCDLKQGYTQYGGLRPFGVSILYAGYDPHYEFQLYHSDPSGNYSGWKATCIGANSGTAQSLLKQEYKDDILVKDAIGLVLRTMSKTMDMEFAVLTLDPTTKTPKAKIYRPHEIDALLLSEGLTKKDEDTEMKSS
ncbi:hypothetical protein H1R20_g14525, partial [Candolleomyces eurysporus]